MNIPTRGWTVIIIVFGLIAGWYAAPADFLNPGGIKDDAEITLGLDLQGGLQVLLEADPPEGREVDEDTLNGTRDTIERRVNELGVSEPLIQTRGDNQIIVELPGVDDPEQAITTLQQTALLEIVDASSGTGSVFEGQTITTTLGGPEDLLGEEQLGGETPAAATPGAGTPVAGTPQATPVDSLSSTDPITGATPVTDGATPVATPGAATPVAETPPADEGDTGPAFTTIIEGRNITEAFVSQGTLGGWVVNFELDDEGAEAFYDFTVNNVGRQMGIVVDKTVISAPVIEQPISGSGQISGLNLEQANALAVQLNAGSLQVPLVVRSSNTIGPTLGQDSIDRSLIAGGIGLATVAIFMIVYYRVPGVLSVLALLIYTAVSVSVFKLLGVTLTLAGIAGFILSIGMAVDANVLIFARLKEELRSGHTIGRAVEASFRNAFPSIRDSNVSTLITCLILWYFGDQSGTSLITAFAITLAIGVFVSLLTAITITRNFMRVTVSDRVVRDPWLLGVERWELEAARNEGQASAAGAGD